ncbi:hypothetical protein [Paenirhodobacter enshiensis]|uniref:hypothetical protein n=1 Tax=Paenirhodobacter enshiensis TaxID=1105367 RepID=UPI001378CD31|nr:hypothetical protein [Paenirhodobacter enshiensis]
MDQLIVIKSKKIDRHLPLGGIALRNAFTRDQEREVARRIIDRRIDEERSFLCAHFVERRQKASTFAHNIKSIAALLLANAAYKEEVQPLVSEPTIVIGVSLAIMVPVDAEGPEVADAVRRIDRSLAEGAGTGKLLMDHVREVAAVEKVMIDWGTPLPPLLK